MREHCKGRGRGGQRTGANGNKQRSSHPWINAQIIAASENGGLQHLLGVIMEYLPQMNLVNLSTAAHRVAKNSADSPGEQQALRCSHVVAALMDAIYNSLTTVDIDEVQPQSLSNVSWSLATLRLMKLPLIQVVASLAEARVSNFKPFELSTMLWGFAKLGKVENAYVHLKPVFNAAAHHTILNVEVFGFRCLATTVWAFATAKQRHARLMKCVAKQMTPMAGAANPQEMANTVWAFATADFVDEPLFQELADKAIPRLGEFKPQELSNMLWGFATNGFFHEDFYREAALAAQKFPLQSQHLANILWALARVRPRHQITRSTLLALLPHCTARLSTFKPQEVSSTALAVGKAFGFCDDDGFVDERLMGVALPPVVLTFFNAVTPWALNRLGDFSAQSLANTVSAYASLRIGDGMGLFEAVAAEVWHRCNCIQPTEMLHLLKGFASAPSGTGNDIIKMLASGVARHLRSFKVQELQLLSRICSDLLGQRHRVRDIGTEELESCLLLIGGGGQALPEVQDPVQPRRRVLHNYMEPMTPGLQQANPQNQMEQKRVALPGVHLSQHIYYDHVQEQEAAQEAMPNFGLVPLAPLMDVDYLCAAELERKLLADAGPRQMSALAMPFSLSKMMSREAASEGTTDDSACEGCEGSAEEKPPRQLSEKSGKSERWRYAVKNSFLHVYSQESDSESSDNDMPLMTFTKTI